MLRIKSFSNAAEFQKLFGLREMNNGKKVRQNKILLAHLKSESLWRYVRKNPQYAFLLEVTNMAELEKAVFAAVQECSIREQDNYCILMESRFGSADYETDELKGLCEDGDGKSIRYRNVETERIYKMKAGRFMTKIFEGCSVGRALARQVTLYFAGDVFSQKWEAYTEKEVGQYELHVDKNFTDIYDSACLKGNFGSCMVNENRHEFFEKSIDCKAAYLTDSEGMIVARAILYNHVEDEDGNEYRLLERQYATEQKDFLKRLLVDKLIAAKEIDGYKAVGASCHDGKNFVLNDGTSISDKTLSISCYIEYVGVISYADSFKYYASYESTAYNDSDCTYDYELDTTDEYLDMDYDDYHDCHCRETTEVLYRGREIRCDSDDLDDFIWVKSENMYVHEDDVSQCEECLEYFVTDRGWYSELTEDYYCCALCMEEAEERYKRDNLYYAEYDEGYFEDEDEIIIAYLWKGNDERYEETTIHIDTINRLVRTGAAVIYEEEYYIGFDEESRLPYNVEKSATA